MRRLLHFRPKLSSASVRPSSVSLSCTEIPAKSPASSAASSDLLSRCQPLCPPKSPLPPPIPHLASPESGDAAAANESKDANDLHASPRRHAIARQGVLCAGARSAAHPCLSPKFPKYLQPCRLPAVARRPVWPCLTTHGREFRAEPFCFSFLVFSDTRGSRAGLSVQIAEEIKPQLPVVQYRRREL